MKRKNVKYEKIQIYKIFISSKCGDSIVSYNKEMWVGSVLSYDGEFEDYEIC